MTMKTKVLRALVLLLLFVTIAESKKKKKPTNVSSDTNVFDFFRLLLFRIIYGFAKMFGVEEGFSDFIGGVFVPPDDEDADYRDYVDDPSEEQDYF